MEGIFTDEYFMRMAYNEAPQAFDADEVPVGAVIACGNKIVARAYNQTELLNDVTAHAEIIAITSASSYLNHKYLNECTLYVTLEPCVMCAVPFIGAKSVASFTPPRTINGDLCAIAGNCYIPTLKSALAWWWRNVPCLSKIFSNKTLITGGIGAPVPMPGTGVGIEVSDTRIPDTRLPRCRSKFFEQVHLAFINPWLCRQWLCGSCQSRHPWPDRWWWEWKHRPCHSLWWHRGQWPLHPLCCRFWGCDWKRRERQIFCCDCRLLWRGGVFWIDRFFASVEARLFICLVHFIPVHERTKGGVAIGFGGEGSCGFVAVVNLGSTLGKQ